MTIVQSSIPLAQRRSDNARAIALELDCCVYTASWASSSTIAVGHDASVSLLELTSTATTNLPTEIQRKYAFERTHMHIGKRVTHVKLAGGTLAASHPDFTLTLLRQGDEALDQLVLGGTRGHSSTINDIDVSHDGQLVASTGEDRFLLVWEAGVPTSFRLAGSGHKVRFWNESDSDRVVVIEAGNKVRVFDWRKEQWLVTIYPNRPVQDVAVLGDKLIVVGEGWWQRYDINSLVGGCGFTPAQEEGNLYLSERGIASFSNGSLVCVTRKGAHFANLQEDGEGGVFIEAELPFVDQVSISPSGEAAIVPSGNSLYLFA